MTTIDDYRQECQRLETLLLQAIKEKNDTQFELEGKVQLLIAADLQIKARDRAINEKNDMIVEFAKQVAEMIQVNTNAQGRLLIWVNEAAIGK